MNSDNTSNSPELSIIIVSWNVKKYLRNCLVSLKMACQQIESGIIVVDNDSIKLLRSSQ